MKKIVNPYIKGIPYKIKVLVNTYRVILVPELTHDDKDRCHGICDTTAKTISLDSHSNANLAEVLLHELMHAIWYEKGMLDFKTLNEEQTVNGFSIGLTLLMQENKMLRNYLNKHWSHK